MSAKIDNSELFLDELTSDFKIILGNEKIPAHKSVLSDTSEYFKAMFAIGMIESELNELKLEDQLIKPFELVLKIAYGLVITDDDWNCLPFNDIFEAIIIANKYQFIETEIIISNNFLKKLKENSTEYITEEINYKIIENKNKRKEKFLSILEVHDLAKSYNLIYFTEISKIHIEKKAQQVMDSWKSLYNYWW